MIHKVEQGEIEGTTLFLFFFFFGNGDNEIDSEVNQAQHSFGCPMFHRFFFFFLVGSWVMDYFTLGSIL
jgi:hypothetical protein